MQRKGIILAGGRGTRLHPLTIGLSKALLPVYDKPMIYYPLSVLMLAGIREIAIITTPEDQDLFQRVLGDGGHLGVSLTWIAQPSPDGLAQAYLLAEEFLDGAPSAMVLGDNLFFGNDLTERLARADANPGATVFACRVSDPERYGVVAFEGDRVTGIVEKPAVPPSNYAVTGIYFLPGDAPRRARDVQPSARGELEIVSLLEMYLEDGQLGVEKMGRGYAWFDAGTHASLLEAGTFVQALQDRQGLLIGAPEEIAHARGWMSDAQLREAAARYGKSGYGARIGASLEDRADRAGLPRLAA